VVNPTGTATIEGDGYRVSGRWPFASGSSHAEIFFLNCLVHDADGMRMEGGLPEMRVVGLRRDQVEILDTWHTTGLAGTASNDVEVTDAIVPAAYSYAPFVDPAIDPAPLYRWRWLFIAKMPAVPLGVARAAIDEAVSVASTKMTMPSFALAREDATVQANIGRATALVHGARAYVDDTIGVVWDAMCSGREPTPAEWVDTRLAMTMACTNSKEAVSLLYEALGTTGVYRRSVLDRQLRDVITMGQHVVSQTKTYAASGRRLLGLEPGIPGF
jgi:alkylation response protein AidB-like acyl-CoA dehydrogenase